jgi:hypothetical protein
LTKDAGLVTTSNPDWRTLSIVTATRLLVLTLGPPVLVSATYLLSLSPLKREHAESTAHAGGETRRSFRFHGEEHDAPAQACQATAEQLSPALPSSFRVILRPPFVLAGDLPESELDRLHRETVRPVASALWRSYFDRKPDQPVTIVALAGESSYRTAAASLDGYEPTAYAGYTQRGARRIVFNLATGDGTLAHELAHILAAFDFPAMPEWFDEGLAALHESASFSDDGLTMIGTANWRTRLLRDALRQGELPTLESVIASPAFRGEGEGLNYAVVRCFCQYLQERGLLSHFYRKFRGAGHEDPEGVATLCELLGRASLAEVDRDFRRWAMAGG